MGGVSFSGIMPWDVARLTSWQIVNDFLKPRAELMKQMKGEQPFVEPKLPTLAEHITAMRGLGSQASVEELTAQHAELARQWAESERGEGE